MRKCKEIILKINERDIKYLGQILEHINNELEKQGVIPDFNIEIECCGMRFKKTSSKVDVKS